MKTIHFAGEVFSTGDDLADALVSYAAALGRVESSRAVTLPIRAVSGETEMVDFLLGPASQIVVVPELSSGDDELTDTSLVKELTDAARRLDSPHPSSADDNDSYAREVDDLDLDFP